MEAELNKAIEDTLTGLRNAKSTMMREWYIGKIAGLKLALIIAKEHTK